MSRLSSLLICVTVAVIAFVVWPYLPTVIDLRLSSTKWVIPKLGSNHVTFHLTANADLPDIKSIGTYPSGSIILADEQRDGYVIFPDDEGNTTHPFPSDHNHLEKKGNRVELTSLADLYHEPDGKRYLFVAGHRYLLGEVGRYEVFAVYGDAEKGLKSHYLYVDVSDE